MELKKLKILKVETRELKDLPGEFLFRVRFLYKKRAGISLSILTADAVESYGDSGLLGEFLYKEAMVGVLADMPAVSTYWYTADIFKLNAILERWG